MKSDTESGSERAAPVRHRGAARNGGGTTGIPPWRVCRRAEQVADTFTATTANMTPAGVNLRMQILDGRKPTRAPRPSQRSRPGPTRRRRSEAADGRLRLAERQPRRLLREVRAPRAAA